MVSPLLLNHVPTKTNFYFRVIVQGIEKITLLSIRSEFRRFGEAQRIQQAIG